MRTPEPFDGFDDAASPARLFTVSPQMVGAAQHGLASDGGCPDGPAQLSEGSVTAVLDSKPNARSRLIAESLA